MSDSSISVRTLKAQVRQQPEQIKEMSGTLSAAQEPLETAVGRMGAVKTKILEAIAELAGIQNELTKGQEGLNKGAEEAASSAEVFARVGDDSEQLTPVAMNIGSIATQAAEYSNVLTTVVDTLDVQRQAATAIVDKLTTDIGQVDAASKASIQMSQVAISQVEPVESWLAVV